MKKFLLAMAALLSFSAFAATGTYTESSGNYGQLTDEPCVLKDYKDIEGVKGGKLKIGDKEYTMCYAVIGDMVLMVDEDGDQYAVPLELFK